MQFYSLTQRVRHEILVSGHVARGLNMETMITEIQKSFITGCYVSLKDETVKDLEFELEVLSGCKYENCTFENIVFANCDFQGSVFSNATFKNCEFINCTFSFTKFDSCNFVACTITSCNFCITNSLNSNFESCTYFYSEYEYSNFNGNEYVDCELDSETELQLTGTHNQVLSSFHTTPLLCLMAA